MARKSTVIGLPIVPFNQNKYSDMCLYLEYLESFLSKLYNNERAAAEHQTADNQTADHHTTEYQAVDLSTVDLSTAELPNDDDTHPTQDQSVTTKLPLCGDLLGRERVTGVKKMRMGCDNPRERFENIFEYPALWHAKQSFLGVKIVMLVLPKHVGYSRMHVVFC